MSDLKSCPFCNGTHSINVINFFTADSFRKCDICGAEAPEAKTPEEAAEKWNTRPAEDAKDKEIERLKLENEGLCSTIRGMEKTIGRAEKVLGERNLLNTEVERLNSALHSIEQNAEFWDNEDDSLAIIHRIAADALGQGINAPTGESEV